MASGASNAISKTGRGGAVAAMWRLLETTMAITIGLLQIEGMMQALFEQQP